jgi:hypothetical protein
MRKERIYYGLLGLNYNAALSVPTVNMPEMWLWFQWRVRALLMLRRAQTWRRGG